MWARQTIYSGALLAALTAAPNLASADCAPPTPKCHLDSGKQLLKTDPKKAAEEFLASFKLDERTETLELYAQALSADKQHALAYETLVRIATYRESELVAAKEKKLKGAALAKIQKAAAAAAAAVTKNEANVARVRVKFGPGVKPTVTRDGIEVDAMKEIVVKTGKDELVFTAKDGKVERRVVELASGDNVRIEYPDPLAKPVDPTPVAPIDPKPVDPKPQPDPDPQPEPGPMPDLRPTPMAMTEKSPGMKKLGLVLAATGVVLGGVAGTVGLLGANDYDDARATGCDDDGGCAIGNREGLRLMDRANDRARFAQISAIGAGALLVTGVVLYVVGGKQVESSSATVGVTLTPNESSATLSWSF